MAKRHTISKRKMHTATNGAGWAQEMYDEMTVDDIAYDKCFLLKSRHPCYRFGFVHITTPHFRYVAIWGIDLRGDKFKVSTWDRLFYR